MPVYEYGCSRCGQVTSIIVRHYEGPDSVPCERCSSDETKRLVSQVSFRVAAGLKYSGDFTEKSLPSLKRKHPQAFEGNRGESDEAKATKINDRIGKQIDRVIDTRLSG